MITEHELVPYSPSTLPSGPYIVFAPHPDDETLGMGGTIILAAKAGIDVYVIFVTDGGKGGEPAVRKQEAKAASEILGVKKIFHLNLPDREVTFIPFPEQTVAQILEQVKPKTIFLPSFQENHPDHRATTHCVLSCFENLIKNRSAFDSNNFSQFDSDLWFYEINRQGEINKLIDISSVLDIKESAIECYASQLEQLDYKVHALCLNCMRSITLGGESNYAEGFWSHDASDEISPCQYYFNRLFQYIPLSRQTKLITVNSLSLSNKSSVFTQTADAQLRRLRDKLNNQASTLLKYFSFSHELAKYINDKINEIRVLHNENNKYAELIREFEQTISKITLSRSHRLASAYIRFVTQLRNFIRKPKNKNIAHTNHPIETSASIVSDSTKLAVSNSPYLVSVPIGDGEEPIIRLYSEHEIDGSVQEHDIYLESTTYGNNKVHPLVNNQPVTFSINCVKNNLARIDLFMATYMRVNPGILVLSLYQHSNIEQLLRISKVVSPGILDNSFVSFDFEPITDSDGKKIYLSLCLIDGVDEICPGLWVQLKKLNSVEQYHKWIAHHEKRDFKSLPDNSYQPYIAIILPVLNSNILREFLENDSNMISKTVESVIKQSYKNWRMTILNSLIYDHNSSEWNEWKTLLGQYTDDNRISICNYNVNSNIANELNRAVDNSECSYFFVMKLGDTISADALHECVKVLNQFPDTDCIYSDEDKLSKDGVRFEPFFKPGWSPDLLLSFMYIGNLIIYRKEVFQNTDGYSSELERCHEYDLLLKLTELTQSIRHIPKVLYHRRDLTPVLFDRISSVESIKNAIKRRGVQADVCEGLTEYSFRVSYKFEPDRLVSIIIPFKDNHEILYTCIQSIVKKTEYKNYEIICVNNQSKNREQFMEMDIYGYGSLKSIPDLNLTLLDYDKPFNYSAINNFAVKHAKGDVILFLNSDTEVISDQWLNAMLEYACRDNVGAVGAKLYYVNDTIQHAGVVVGIAGIAGHAFKHINRYDKNFYHGFPCMVRNVSAVTGACMMIKRSVFEEVRGFDEEHFEISYNDLDLCLKIREKGYEVIYTPFAELYHYESYSRGYCFDPIATDNIKAKWGKVLESDPFYNPNITIYKEDWSLA